MRKFIIASIAIIVAFGSVVASASAGDRHYRQRNGDAAIGGAIIGAIAGAIIGGAIASQPRQYNGYEPRYGDRYQERRRDNYRYGGGYGIPCRGNIWYDPRLGGHRDVRSGLPCSGN